MDLEMDNRLPRGYLGELKSAQKGWRNLWVVPMIFGGCLKKILFCGEAEKRIRSSMVNHMVHTNSMDSNGQWKLIFVASAGSIQVKGRMLETVSRQNETMEIPMIQIENMVISLAGTEVSGHSMNSKILLWILCLGKTRGSF